MEGKIVDWDEVKDKPFKILLYDLPYVVELMRKLGLDIVKEKEQYWLRVNYPKLKWCDFMDYRQVKMVIEWYQNKGKLKW